MIQVMQEGNLVPVPPELADEYGLSKGSRVDWERSSDGSWVLRPALSRGDFSRRLLGAGSAFVKPGESAVLNFLRSRDDDARLDNEA